MADWTFLTNHAMVLSFLARNPRITAREIATAIGITERTVRKIIADLELEGYISKRREGRRLHYRINPNLTLRHESYQEMVIGDFLEALGWKRRRKNREPKEENRAVARLL